MVRCEKIILMPCALWHRKYVIIILSGQGDYSIYTHDDEAAEDDTLTVAVQVVMLEVLLLLLMLLDTLLLSLPLPDTAVTPVSFFPLSTISSNAVMDCCIFFATCNLFARCCASSAPPSAALFCLEEDEEEPEG